MAKAFTPTTTASTVSATALLATADFHLAAPLAFGVLGVVLARIVFVERENRKLRRAQSIRETLPLTLVAALIEVAIVVEFDLNLPKAIFAGLGTGWVAIALLDVIGDRALAIFAPSLAQPRQKMRDAPEDTPETMTDLTRLIDRSDQQHRDAK